MLQFGCVVCMLDYIIWGYDMSCSLWNEVQLKMFREKPIVAGRGEVYKVDWNRDRKSMQRYSPYYRVLAVLGLRPKILTNSYKGSFENVIVPPAHPRSRPVWYLGEGDTGLSNLCRFVSKRLESSKNYLSALKRLNTLLGEWFHNPYYAPFFEAYAGGIVPLGIAAERRFRICNVVAPATAWVIRRLQEYNYLPAGRVRVLKNTVYFKGGGRSAHMWVEYQPRTKELSTQGPIVIDPTLNTLLTRREYQSRVKNRIPVPHVYFK